MYMKKIIVAILLLLQVVISFAIQSNSVTEDLKQFNKTDDSEISNKNEQILNKLENEHLIVMDIIDLNEDNYQKFRLNIQFQVLNYKSEEINAVCKAFESEIIAFLQRQTYNQSIKVISEISLDSKCYLTFEQYNFKNKSISFKGSSEMYKIAKNDVKNLLKNMKIEQLSSIFGLTLQSKSYSVYQDQSNLEQQTTFVDLIHSQISKQNLIYDPLHSKRMLQQTSNSNGDIFESDKSQDDDDDVFIQKHLRQCLGNIGLLFFISHTIMYFALQGDDKDRSFKKESIFDQPYISFSRQQSQVQESESNNRAIIQNNNAHNNNVVNQNQDDQLHQLNQTQNVHNRVYSEVLPSSNINNNNNVNIQQIQSGQIQQVEINIVQNNSDDNNHNNNNNNDNINHNNNNNNSNEAHNNNNSNEINANSNNNPINQIENQQGNRNVQENNQQQLNQNQMRVFPAQQNQNNANMRIKYNPKIIFLHAKYAYYKKIENTPRWMRIFFIFVYMSVFQMIHSFLIQKKHSSNVSLFIIVNALTWLGVYIYSGIFYLIFYLISPDNRENNKCSKYLIIFIIYIINLLYVTSNYTRTIEDSAKLFFWPLLYLLIDQFAIDYIFLYISMKYSLIRYAKLFSIKASPNQ